jgi:FdhD protein
MSMPAIPPFSAVLLAGGRSTRMGSDKALMPWQGEPLWQHQLRILQDLEPTELFISARIEQALAAEAVVLILDPPGIDEGPLGAITRCLRQIQRPLLVLAIDMPAMTSEFLQERLLASFDGVHGLVFSGSHGYETLAALYTPSMLPLLDEALAVGRLGLQDVLGRAVERDLMQVKHLRPQDEVFFRNLNTPEDVARIADDAFATPVRVARRQKGNPVPQVHDDVVAREEPLEIRVEGRSVAVVMRTPGHDRELVAGFLVSEGVVQKSRDVLEISQCPSTGNSKGNIVDVLLGGAVVNWESLTRHVFSASSCGLCGKTSIESVFQRFPPVRGGWQIEPGLLWSLPEKLRSSQATFSRTGGLHACALFDLEGNLIVVREDVGRHNALDKVLGHGLLHDLLPFDQHLLLLSGRVSFEMMQKALAAGIPLVAAISAPSSLAVDFAEESNQTLIGFLREQTMNVYTHDQRLKRIETQDRSHR